MSLIQIALRDNRIRHRADESALLSSVCSSMFYTLHEFINIPRRVFYHVHRFERNRIAWHFKMITSNPSISSHQNTREIDYLNSRNNHISVTAWDRFVYRRSDREKKRITAHVVPSNSRAQRYYMTTQRPKVMINRGSICVSRSTPLRSALPVPFSEPHAPRRESRVCVHRRTQTAYELRGLVHACTHGRILAAAAEYNSGNTMELGQSCFDARLRSFHLLRRVSFGHVSPLIALEVSVSLSDKQKYTPLSVGISRPRRRVLRVLLCA